MSFKIPTFTELVQQTITAIQNRINQTVPATQKAFARVIAVAFALLVGGLYKFAAERALQALAITATGENLEVIGAQYGVQKRKAQAAVLEANLPATNGTNIPATVSFIGAVNQVRYFLAVSVIAGAGGADLTLTAETPGAVGNLDNGAALNIAFQVPGAGTVATVTATTTTGADEEEEETYRRRVLDRIRNSGGGGDNADYRRWANEAAGVEQSYPYAGQPFTSGLPSSPPDRTVYVEAQTSINADGIAPQSLLDDVRDIITTDPATGLARQPLGITDETLFVESISRLAFFVDVRGLVVDASKEVEAKADIETALALYFLNTKMFVIGIDFAEDKADTITAATVGTVITDALRATGGTIQSVAFGFFVGDVVVSYTLNPGELSKLEPGGVSYS